MAGSSFLISVLTLALDQDQEQNTLLPKVQRNQGHAPAVADSPQEAVSEKIFGSKRSSRCNNHKFLPGYEADEASLRKEGQALGFLAWRRPWGGM